jgi:hypothetical protein
MATITTPKALAHTRGFRYALVSVCVVALVTAVGAAAATPALNLTLSGTIKGAPLKGKVQFAHVTCVPLSNNGLLVQWNGSVMVKKRTFKSVNGEINFSKTGKSAFGPKGPATASLVVNGDYSGRLASGLPGGSGTGTVSRNRKTGSVNALVVYGRSKVRMQGTWVCG